MPSPPTARLRLHPQLPKRRAHLLRIRRLHPLEAAQRLAVVRDGITLVLLCLVKFTEKPMISADTIDIAKLLE